MVTFPDGRVYNGPPSHVAHLTSTQAGYGMMEELRHVSLLFDVNHIDVLLKFRLLGIGTSSDGRPIFRLFRNEWYGRLTSMQMQK